MGVMRIWSGAAVSPMCAVDALCCVDGDIANRELQCRCAGDVLGRLLDAVGSEAGVLEKLWGCCEVNSRRKQ